MPDMAFLLERPSIPAPVDARILFFLRSDQEKALDVEAVRHGLPAVRKDWTDILGTIPLPPSVVRRRVWRALRAVAKRAAPVAGPSLFLHVCAKETGAYKRFAELCEQLAFHEFGRYRAVVTDRLHGHIIATVLRIPNVLLANSYGKNKSFFDTWTWNDPIARFAGTADEALSQLLELLESS
jgi:pyruvyl transferase EpsO